MPTVHDIAAYIMEKRGPMTAMKLQKLAYYTQAWSLATTDAPAFPERIEAWAQGPVVYELFDKHRRQFVVQAWPFGDSTHVPPPVRRVVDAVLAYYGAMSAEALSALTHAEEPWREARAGMPEGLPSSPEITQASMARFYRAQPLPPAFAS